VAVLGHFLFGMPWAVGFVLGAVVAPPDAVAPMAVMKHLRLPRRLITVLEGESLVNDATALVIFGFALSAVVTGTFSVPAAAGRFLAIVVGEIAYAVIVGWLILRVRHLAADPLAEVLLALATPFLAFWPPHAAGGSGVVACVATGLYVSWNGQRLIRPATRLQGYFIWGLVAWSIEALVFLLTGLQARAVVSGISGEGWNRALAAGLLVSLAVILVRFIWVFPAAVADPSRSPGRPCSQLALAISRVFLGTARRGDTCCCPVHPTEHRRPSLPRPGCPALRRVLRHRGDTDCTRRGIAGRRAVVGAYQRRQTRGGCRQTR